MTTECFTYLVEYLSLEVPPWGCHSKGVRLGGLWLVLRHVCPHNGDEPGGSVLVPDPLIGGRKGGGRHKAARAYRRDNSAQKHAAARF